MDWYIEAFVKFAEFKGRSRRKKYWMFAIISACVALFIRISAHATHSWYLNVARMIYDLIIFVPAMALNVRRMHDIGLSGWWGFIPLYGIWLASKPGVEGPNQFGPDPKTQNWETPNAG